MAQEELQKTPNGVSVQGKLRLRNGLPAEGEFTVFATAPDAREAVTAAASLLETPGD